MNQTFWNACFSSLYREYRNPVISAGLQEEGPVLVLAPHIKIL